MKTKYLILFFVLLLSGCYNETPIVDGGNTGSPQDTNMYLIRGTIVADITSLTRQIAPASGGMYGNYAYYTGPIIDGKTFLRIVLIESRPKLPNIEKGQILIIKSVDTKAQALLPGDTLSFKCRRQYEAVAKLSTEDIDWNKQASWEIDFCRLVDGVITIK